MHLQQGFLWWIIITILLSTWRQAQRKLHHFHKNMTMCMYILAKTLYNYLIRFKVNVSCSNHATTAFYIAAMQFKFFSDGVPANQLKSFFPFLGWCIIGWDNQRKGFSWSFVGVWLWQFSCKYPISFQTSFLTAQLLWEVRCVVDSSQMGMQKSYVTNLSMMHLPLA